MFSRQLRENQYWILKVRENKSTSKSDRAKNSSKKVYSQPKVMRLLLQNDWYSVCCVEMLTIRNSGGAALVVFWAELQNAWNQSSPLNFHSHTLAWANTGTHPRHSHPYIPLFDYYHGVLYCTIHRTYSTPWLLHYITPRNKIHRYPEWKMTCRVSSKKRKAWKIACKRWKHKSVMWKTKELAPTRQWSARNWYRPLFCMDGCITVGEITTHMTTTQTLTALPCRRFADYFCILCKIFDKAMSDIFLKFLNKLSYIRSKSETSVRLMTAKCPWT